MLFDSLDGGFMNFAYGWASARPARKVYYNLVVTGLSIAAAFLVGSVEIPGVLADELHLHGAAFWAYLPNLISIRRVSRLPGLSFCVGDRCCRGRFGWLEARWEIAGRRS